MGTLSQMLHVETVDKSQVLSLMGDAMRNEILSNQRTTTEVALRIQETSLKQAEAAKTAAQACRQCDEVVNATRSTLAANRQALEEQKAVLERCRAEGKAIDELKGSLDRCRENSKAIAEEATATTKVVEEQRTLLEKCKAECKAVADEARAATNTIEEQRQTMARSAAELNETMKRFLKQRALFEQMIKDAQGALDSMIAGATTTLMAFSATCKAEIEHVNGAIKQIGKRPLSPTKRVIVCSNRRSDDEDSIILDSSDVDLTSDEEQAPKQAEEEVEIPDTPEAKRQRTDESAPEAKRQRTDESAPVEKQMARRTGTPFMMGKRVSSGAKRNEDLTEDLRTLETNLQSALQNLPEQGEVETVGLDGVLAMVLALLDFPGALPLAVEIVGPLAVVNVTVVAKLAEAHAQPPIPDVRLSSFKGDRRTLVCFRRPPIRNDPDVVLYRDGETMQRLSGKTAGALPWALELSHQSIPEYGLTRSLQKADDRQVYVVFPVVLFDEPPDWLTVKLKPDDKEPKVVGPGLLHKTKQIPSVLYGDYVAAIRRLTEWMKNGEGEE